MREHAGPSLMGKERNQSYLSYLGLLAAFLLSASLAHAQEFRAVILGQISDPSGAVVANARVTAVREGSQQSYAVQSNAAGDYSLPYVLPGVYTVTVEAAGFKKTVQPRVILDVSQKLNLNFSLEIGSVNEVVTVKADTATLSTGDASGGTVMDPDKVQALPLNGRQVYMLLNLTPGVRFTQTQFGSSGFSGTRGWDVNSSYVINGVPGGYNQFTLNGAPITVQQNGTWEISPNIDGVEEFKVMTNTYDAQYGRTGGGTVNIVMKSGTNAFHGTGFDYWRNSVVDANTFTNNYLGKPKGLHNQHQFGGTLGGPLQKDKAFFFFSFEGWREVVPFPVTNVSVPPVGTDPTSLIQMMPDGSVNFTNSGINIYDPLTTTCVQANTDGSCKTYGRTLFPNDTIPANRISPIGAKILAFYPQPNIQGATLFNNFNNTGLEGRYNYNQPIVRIDRNFGAKTRLYGLYTWWRGHEFRNTSGFTGPAQRGNVFTERDDTNVVLDLTHTFTNSLVADLRFAFGRYHSNFPDGSISGGTAKLTAPDLGLTMPAIPTTSAKWPPQIQVDSYSDIIGNTVSIEMDNTFDVAPSVTHIHGRHVLHYGGEYLLIQRANPGVGQPNGSFHFGAGFTQQNPFVRANSKDGFGLADLLLGYPDNGGSAGSKVQWNTTYFGSYPYLAFYVQDDFKIRRNLTLNLGVRWDDEFSVKERFNRINAGFCFTCINPATSQINYAGFPNLPNPLLGGQLFAGVGGAPARPYNNYLTQWQPRFGIAWAITPKTVFRGGYGIQYAFGIELDTQNGFSQTTNYINSLDGGLTPSGYFNTGTPYPNGVVSATGSSLGLLTSVGNGIGFDAATRRIPRVQQWSAGIQRDLPGEIMLDVSYVGSYTNQLRASRQWDTLTPAEIAQGAQNPAFLDAQVSNPFYGVLQASTSLGSSKTVSAYQLMLPYPEFTSVYEFTDPNGYANYHALQVKAQKKIAGTGALTRGLSFLGSFTWSKAMNASSRNGSNAFLNNGLIQDAYPTYEVADFDRPWDFAFSGVWGLPIGRGGLLARNAKGFLGALIDNWSVEGIFQDAGGTPTGVPNAILTCSSYVSPQQSYSEWINNDSTCYKPYPEWTPRTTPLRVSYIRNPWAPQLGMAMQKQFALLKEGQFLQFRGEAFNLTNTPIFPGPDTNRNDKIGTDAFGHATGFGSVALTQQNFPRQIQMSLKFIF
jgi:hypothetical protein